MSTKSFHVFDETMNWLKQSEISFWAQESTTSTNDIAKSEAATTFDECKVYLAGYQSQGRGRKSNTWTSLGPEDQLLMTWSFELDKPPQPITTPLVGLCIFEALENVFPNQFFSMKAPNDLLLEGKKFIGLLCETVQVGARTRLIVGMGMNVFTSPNDIANATHLSANSNVTANAYRQFLDTTKNNFQAALLDISKPSLTPSHRKRILDGLNKNPNLPTKFIAISPFGDLITESETVSWRDL